MRKGPSTGFTSPKWKAPARAFLTAAALGCLTPLSPAAAEVRLGQDTNADYRIQVMTWWEIPFRSVVRQRYDFSCGSAAVATLLTFHYGHSTSEREVFADMWAKGNQETIRKVGFSMLEMKEYLDRSGYRTNGLRLTTEQFVKLRRPMIVLIELNGFAHFVVVKGVSDGQVLTGDSVLGLRQYSLEDFEKMWNHIALVVADAPNGQTAKFNLASDWGPWSSAPIEQESQRMQMAIGDSTNLLLPYYQILPEFLLAVRVGTVR